MSNSRSEDGLSERVRWARAFPELGTAPIPTDRCLAPEYFALERDKIFKRVWLKVGRVEELPTPRLQGQAPRIRQSLDHPRPRRRRRDPRFSQHLLPSRQQGRLG